MIALVTGASSGIGAATARRLAAEPDARLVLVARRRDRLDALAAELGGATVIAADLLDEATPKLIAERVESEHGRLDLVVNSAGVGGRGTFAKSGWAEVERTMAINFDAQVRLAEAVLPLLRRSAPSAIVFIGSVASRVSRARAGSYSASKFALAGWTEALYMEERRHGVHVALVQPGFVATEGFPQRELLARPWTRWMVSTDDKVAEAVVEAWRRRQAERYVPGPTGSSRSPGPCCPACTGGWSAAAPSPRRCAARTSRRPPSAARAGGPTRRPGVRPRPRRRGGPGRAAGRRTARW